MGPEDEFVNAIASDVLKVLAEQRFFENLDDQMCPKDSDSPRLSCTGGFEISANILANAAFESGDISDIRPFCDRKAPAAIARPFTI
jgi:hypothetical protein